MEPTPEQLKLLIQFQQQEITGYLVYRKLAIRQKDEHNREVLNRIADDEMEHYKRYRTLTGREVSANKREIFKYSILSLILGPTFGIKLMEKNEANDQILYTQLSDIPDVS